MQDLELRDDGSAVIRVGEAEWVLRRPTLGEYRKAFELFQAADDRLQAALVNVTDPTEKVKVANRMQLGDDGAEPLYGQLLCAFIALLDTSEIDVPAPADVPAWAVSSDVTAQLLRHWRAVPLDRGAPA